MFGLSWSGISEVVSSGLRCVSKIPGYLPAYRISRVMPRKKWEPEGITLLAMGALMSAAPSTKFKIWWGKHIFSLQSGASYKAALERRMGGQGREDLVNFREGIKVALNLCPPSAIPYGERPVELADLEPLTYLWYCFVDGLISLQKSYGYEPDKNISLEHSEEITLEAEMEWKEKNDRVAYQDPADKDASQALHECIVKIKRALTNGYAPSEDLSELAARVKGNYHPADFARLKETIAKIKNEAKKIQKEKIDDEEKASLNWSCPSDVELVVAFCNSKIEDFKRFRKEVTRMCP